MEALLVLKPPAAGRIRKGPAPTNLEIPTYDLNEAEGKLTVG